MFTPASRARGHVRRIFTLTNLIRFLAAWTALTTFAFVAAAVTLAAPNSRAVMLMSIGLVVLWICIGGTIMWTQRDRIRLWTSGWRLSPSLTFILFSTMLALLEEAVTVSMTNLAPLFGVPLGAAYITASANYFDVVALHSVVVFIPMFVCWAWMLSRWDFSPAEVFLLFGLTGFLAEAQFAGTLNFIQAPFWIFVYGLMVWLPAYCLPSNENRSRPRWWVYPIAMLLPIIFAMPVAALVATLHPIPIHFPPIPPNS